MPRGVVCKARPQFEPFIIIRQSLYTVIAIITVHHLPHQNILDLELFRLSNPPLIHVYQINESPCLRESQRPSDKGTVKCKALSTVRSLYYLSILIVGGR